MSYIVEYQKRFQEFSIPLYSSFTAVGDEVESSAYILFQFTHAEVAFLIKVQTHTQFKNVFLRSYDLNVISIGKKFNCSTFLYIGIVD